MFQSEKPEKNSPSVTFGGLIQKSPTQSAKDCIKGNYILFIDVRKYKVEDSDSLEKEHPPGAH